MNKKLLTSVILFFYCVLLFSALFLRLGQGILTNLSSLSERITDSANLIPFKTIDNFLKAYKLGNIGLKPMIANLLGNILLFVPMGVILPAVFVRCKKHLFCFFTFIITIVLVEAIQFITGVGRLDVDDFILNLAGAFFGRLLYDIYVLIKRI